MPDPRTIGSPLLGPQIPVSLGQPPVAYSKKNQMERVLAAASVATPGFGAVVNLVFTADQGQTCQLNRMVIESFGSAPGAAGAAGAAGTSGSLAGSLAVTSVVIRNTTQLIRTAAVAPAAPGVGSGIWSAYRNFTGQGQFASIGGGLRLEAGETVVVTVLNLSDTTGGLIAAMPTILDCDLGRPVYGPGFDASVGAAILAAPVVNSGALVASPVFGGQIAPLVNTALIWPEAGIVDLSQLAMSWTGTVQAVSGLSPNEPVEQPFSGQVTQITLIDQSTMITGLGAGLICPGSMFWAGSSQQRPAPWVRLPTQSGTSGNQVAITSTANFSAAGFGTASVTTSAPFYPGRGSKPPIGCV